MPVAESNNATYSHISYKTPKKYEHFEWKNNDNNEIYKIKVK